MKNRIGVVTFAGALGVLILLGTPLQAGWEEGRTAFTQGDFETAAQEFQRVTESHPDWAPGHLFLGEALLRLRRAGDALPHLQKAHELTPQDASTALALGRGYQQAQRPLDAVNLFQGIDEKRLTPIQKGELYSRWALALGDLGREEGAIQLWAQATKAVPENDGFHYEYGVALFNVGRFEEAIAPFRTALTGLDGEEAARQQRLKSLVWALNRHANALPEGNLRKATYAEALESAKDLVTLHGNRTALLLVGEAAMGAEDFQLAVDQYRQTSELDPKDWWSRYQLGQAQVALGDFEAAEASLQGAVEVATLEDHQQRIWRQIAFLYSQQERYAEAAVSYAKGGDAEGAARALHNQQVLEEERAATRTQKELDAIAEKEKEIQRRIECLLRDSPSCN